MYIQIVYTVNECSNVDFENLCDSRVEIGLKGRHLIKNHSAV